MQRGACEAVWLGQPILTSDWPVLRQAFHAGTLHVDNTVAGIRAGVVQMQTRYPQLAHEVLQLQAERRQQWQQAAVLLAATARSAGAATPGP
jgi:hypothetical protein